MGWRRAEPEASVAWLDPCLGVDPLHLAQGAENAGAEVVACLALQFPDGGRARIPTKWASRSEGFEPSLRRSREAAT
jgi:hypothetical protein